MRAALLSSALLFVAACGDDTSDTAASAASAGADESTGAPTPDDDDHTASTPAVLDAWSRQPAAGQSVAAVYGEIVNPTDTDLVLVAASSPVTPRVELHETTTDEGGMMTMGEREDGFVIAPGESLKLEPGGAHVMLLDIDAATYPGEVEVTFEFAGTDAITVLAAVQPIDDGDSAADDATDHGSTDADHSHHEDHGSTGDDESAMGGDGSGAGGPMVIDVGPLHGIDDELIAGDLAPRRQRAIIADYLSLIESHDPADGTPEADLLALLVDLDAALADRDMAASVAIAGEAHDLAHAIDDGTAD